MPDVMVADGQEHCTLVITIDLTKHASGAPLMAYIMFEAWKFGSSSRACTASLGLLKLTAEPYHRRDNPLGEAAGGAVATCSLHGEPEV